MDSWDIWVIFVLCFACFSLGFSLGCAVHKG